MKTIKVIPNKRQGTTHGVRKYLINFTNWDCDLEITLLNGNKRILKAINFMKPQPTKKEAIIEAQKYAEYMKSRGNFYFI